MTELDLYNSALIEQNKLEAPTLLIEEYNYLINKAIIQYINIYYAAFDVTQQMSDNLRWLQRSVELDIGTQNKLIAPMEEANYACYLPKDYFHILNCVVHFAPKGDAVNESKCKVINDDSDNGTYSLCRRLTANQFPALLKNAYFKPSYKNPYFYINTSGTGSRSRIPVETEDIMNPCGNHNAFTEGIIIPKWKQDFYKLLAPCADTGNMILEPTGKIMEIRCGKNSGFYPDTAYVDYLKLPELINLTWDDVQGVEDTTKQCEFPDPVAYEIINIFTKLLLENAGDSRLQSHYTINQTIGGAQKTSTTSSSKE